MMMKQMMSYLRFKPPVVRVVVFIHKTAKTTVWIYFTSAIFVTRIKMLDLS